MAESRSNDRRSRRERRSEARYLRKLDPMLALAATRARDEPKSLGLLAKSASEPQAASAPASVSDLPLGACSLSAPMQVSSVRKLAEQEQVSVLVEASGLETVADKLDSWEGSCQKLTSTTMLARLPRARLRSLASMAAVSYVEASMPLRPHNDLAHLSTGLVVDGQRVVPMTGKGIPSASSTPESTPPIQPSRTAARPGS